jgi:hypothetical protein
MMKEREIMYALTTVVASCSWIRSGREKNKEEKLYQKVN